MLNSLAGRLSVIALSLSSMSFGYFIKRIFIDLGLLVVPHSGDLDLDTKPHKKLLFSLITELDWKDQR